MLPPPPSALLPAPPAGARSQLAPAAVRPAASNRRPRCPRTAFVLSGGASLGALQVGMLRALYERGIVPDLLVGASVGALNAAFVASRPQTPATADELAGVWRDLRREDVFPASLPVVIAGLTRRNDHLVPDRGLRQLVRRYLRIDRLEEATVPLNLVAFDLIGGEEVLLSNGPAIDAILAAAAIPGVLPSVRWGRRRLIDGGVVNNTPISHAIALGAERVYVLPTRTGSLALPKPPAGAVDAAIHGLTLLIESQLRAELARHAGAAELIVLPAPNPRDVPLTDFGHSSGLIEGALVAARSFLDAVPARARSADQPPWRRRARRRPGRDVASRVLISTHAVAVRDPSRPERSQTPCQKPKITRPATTWTATSGKASSCC